MRGLGVITDNLARFSGQGLSNVEALVQDSRRSINRIEEAVTDLSRNPQRILSGGDGEVRQYRRQGAALTSAVARARKNVSCG